MTDQPLIHTRKVKVLAISGGILAELWRTGNKIQAEVTQGLPQDAELVGINWDALNGVARLLFSSAEFEEAEIGKYPPSLEVGLRSLGETSYNEVR